MAGQARPKQTHAHFYTEGGALGAEASRMRPARVPLPWRIYTAAPSAFSCPIEPEMTILVLYQNHVDI